MPDEGALVREALGADLVSQPPALQGEIDGCTLECWLHGSRFDLRTGQPSGPPAVAPVPTYPVEIRDDGYVYVDLAPSNGVLR